MIRREKLTVFACAIMPDHIHLIVRKHRLEAEEMIALFQEDSRLRLRVERPLTSDHPVWGGPGWVVFLDHPDDVERTIPYVENNPKKIGLPSQLWPFVVPYDRWPLHEGHSLNSPYVKRLEGIRNSARSRKRRVAAACGSLHASLIGSAARRHPPPDSPR